MKDAEDMRAKNYNQQYISMAGSLVTVLSIIAGLIVTAGLGGEGLLRRAIFGLVLGTNLQITSYLMQITARLDRQ